MVVIMKPEDMLRVLEIELEAARKRHTVALAAADARAADIKKLELRIVEVRCGYAKIQDRHKGQL